MNWIPTIVTKCFVPTCPNDTSNQPHKLFIFLTETNKKNLCEALNVLYDPNGSTYCCEDHLNVNNDLVEYDYSDNINLRSMPKREAKLNVNATPSVYSTSPDLFAKHHRYRTSPLPLLPYMAEKEEATVSMPSTSKCMQRHVPQESTAMIVPNPNLPARLYLDKFNANIYVDSANLDPHHIECLRFLYRQYTKHKPGVILNYPAGSGMSVLVVLFLNAIYKVMKDPILILYREEEEGRRWQNLINELTSIRIDSGSSFSEVGSRKACKGSDGKTVLVLNNMANVTSYYLRRWSMVVVKSDVVDTYFMKLKLDVQYKIWITSVDVTQDYQLLRLLYTWIYPNSEKRLNDFLHRQSIYDLTTRKLLLEASIEDVVIRRDDSSSCRGTKRKHETPIESATKVSRDMEPAPDNAMKTKYRDKDTAIPSTSKVAVETTTYVDTDDSDSNEDFSMLPNKTTDAVNLYEPAIDKMDIESFIRDNEPLYVDSNSSTGGKTLDNTSQPSGNSSPKEDFEDPSDNVGEDRNITQSSDHNSHFNNMANLTEPVGNTGTEPPPDYCNIKISEVTSLAGGKVHVDNKNPSADEVVDKEGIGEELQGTTEAGAAVNVTKQGTVKDLDIKGTAHLDFETKIKEIEKRVFKKYKGSFLDKMF